MIKNESQSSSPYLKAFTGHAGLGYDHLATEHDKVSLRKNHSSMKEKRRPQTINSGLESIEEEFKNLQDKDIIDRFAP